MRDYIGLCVVFIVFYGTTAFYAIPSLKIAFMYLLALVAQYVLVRQASSNYGIRFVTTVLARWVAKEQPDALKSPVNEPVEGASPMLPKLRKRSSRVD